MSTYITQGTLHCPLVKFLIHWFSASNLDLHVYLYHQGTLHCPLYKISTINSFTVPMSTYITQVISLGPFIAPFLKFVQV